MNAPEHQGQEVDIIMFVDSDHEGDKVSHRSRSSFLKYMSTTHMQWFSKKQSTVETSVFGAEFIAIKQSIDALRGLSFKLRMMGFPTSGPSYLCGLFFFSA